MDKRYLKATALVLGALTAASTIANMSASPAYGQTNVAPAGARQCLSTLVNDAGTAAGTCLIGSVFKGYVRLPTASTSTVLAPSTLQCRASSLSNAAAGSEIIAGSCNDGNGVAQGVFWTSASPTTPPTLLRPLSLLGLVPDVQTKVQAVNALGLMVGISINSKGAPTPVSWASNGLPTALAAPPLAPKMRCNTTGVNDAATPSIIGDCRDYSDSYFTKDVALLWQGATSAYTTLPVPRFYRFCNVLRVNLAGQILGSCYGQGFNAVVWGPGGTGPAVMTTIGGNPDYANAVLQSGGINDKGVVACNYKVGGYTEPCRWDPRNGNTAGTAISIPAGGTGDAVVSSIGDNGVIVGQYSVRGNLFPFYVESGGTVAIGGSSPAGGPNTTVTSMSKSGVNEAFVSEDSSLHQQPLVQTVP